MPKSFNKKRNSTSCIKQNNPNGNNSNNLQPIGDFIH